MLCQKLLYNTVEPIYLVNLEHQKNPLRLMFSDISITP